MSRKPLPFPDVVLDPARLVVVAEQYGVVVAWFWQPAHMCSLACCRCGSEWAVPASPVEWFWIICPRRCNMPKGKRGIEEMVHRVGAGG